MDKMKWRSVASALAVAVVLGAPVAATAQSTAAVAPVLTGLGDHVMPVTTREPRAQMFFNQGVRLLYAFNHPESRRAFEEAARLDPDLAMAYWGQAMTLAPNLNQPMAAAEARLAYTAAQAALARRGSVSARERALIEALSRRLSADAAAERGPLDAAYAEAMKAAAAAYPNDPDVQTFYVDAVMNTMPWAYWQKEGTAAKPETEVIRATLERVIAQHPTHAGAHHYYIHLMEGSATPERAEASADVLGGLMPAAGHIVHMPAHIYIRTGRYADASEANVRAIAADEDYLAQCQAQGLYPLSYYPHNLHFLWAAATLEGRSAVAIEAARDVAAKVPHHHAGAVAWTADFPVTTLLAYTRFGRWTEILTEPAPPKGEPYANGIWHYARAMAFINRGELSRADQEIRQLATVIDHEAFKTTLKDTPLPVNLQIASKLAGAELAARRSRYDESVKLATEATAIEDALPYSEPPLWHHPPRQVLGALLIEAGRPAEAEAVYLKDLERFRENGWSLFGLARSLELQGKRDGARAARARFEQAWSRGDITLTSSRITEEARPTAENATARARR